MTRDQLLAQVQALPAEALLPAAWVRQQLEALTVEAVGEPEVYDVAALAKRWQRSASAVRALLEGGTLTGAWKQGGRAWRIPRAAVLAHEAASGEEAQAVPKVRTRRGRTDPRDPFGLRSAARGKGAAV
jgi:hypothetical protein